MAQTTKKGSPTDPMADEEGQGGWAPLKLIGVGGFFLFCALSVIIWMGSRFEGCVYVDGARSGHALGR
jgi:hypothetical protein